MERCYEHPVGKLPACVSLSVRSVHSRRTAVHLGGLFFTLDFYLQSAVSLDTSWCYGHRNSGNRVRHFLSFNGVGGQFALCRRRVLYLPAGIHSLLGAPAALLRLAELGISGYLYILFRRHDSYPDFNSPKEKESLKTFPYRMIYGSFICCAIRSDLFRGRSFRMNFHPMNNHKFGESMD